MQKRALFDHLDFVGVGDSKESFYIGPLEDVTTFGNPNQWPPAGTSVYRLA